MGKESHIDVARRAARLLHSSDKVGLVGLYGSVASATNRKGSDIDMFVIAKTRDLQSLPTELGRLLTTNGFLIGNGDRDIHFGVYSTINDLYRELGRPLRKDEYIFL